LDPRPGYGKSYVIMERRFLIGIILAFVLALVGVAGYKVLERGKRPPPPLSVKELTRAPGPPAAPKLVEFSDTFGKNETITDALLRHGLTKPQVAEWVKAARPVWPRVRVVAGETFQGNLYPNGEFHEFRYRIDPARYITVYRDGDKFIPEVKKFEFEMRTVAVSGTIRNSLFVAVAEAGEQETLAGDLSNIFAWDVDFDTDIQKGDTFRLLLEKRYLMGQFDRYGHILTAELMVGKKRYSAYRFQNDYFDDNGKSLKKSLLKSPLNFAARVSSRFSGARLHPILKIVRPHYGVDYAAPTGTPVVAVGSGRVVSAGVDGGFGNSVRLHHDTGNIETIYSHLSVIGVHAGQRVAQGQWIGDVGATGLATGPHLDFRVFERGKPVNPLRKIVPDAPPVAANLLRRFIAQRDDLRSRLYQLMSAENNHATPAPPDVAGAHSYK
jgi:murein DD-endopeptidase MepM/ murein hydrolase activator NlpD